MQKHRVILVLVMMLVAAGSLLPLGLGGCSQETGIPTDEVTVSADGVACENAAAVSSPGVESAFDKPPRLLKTVPPEYPQIAQQSGGEGQVTLKIEVKADGTIGPIVTLEEVEGHPELTDAALTTARQLLFEPAQYQGRPGRCAIVIPFQFSLKDSSTRREKS